MKYKNLPCAWCKSEYYDGAHVPARFLISIDARNAFKGQCPVLPSCKKCNQDLKLDEEWFTVHYCSILYEFSDIAKKMFDGPISKHLKNSPLIAERYNNYLELVELIVDGKSHGIKTQIKLSKEDWLRLNKVAEMYARGLYYLHSGKSAHNLRTKTIYLTPKRYAKLGKFLVNLKRISLFPDIFEYAYGIIEETGEGVFYIFIFNKPCYLINFVSEDHFEKLESSVANTEENVSLDQNVEILG